MVELLTIVLSTAGAMLLHELGHLVAASLCRVTASEVALGLGPRVAGFRLGTVCFNLRLLPLGSFVRLNSHELHARPLPQQLCIHMAGICLNLMIVPLAYGTLFGWLNLLLAAGNLLPIYQHDGWKCGLVLVRAILGKKSRPVEWTYTFSGGFVSLLLVWIILRAVC